MPRPTMPLPSPEQLDKTNVMKSGEAKPTFEVHYDEGLKVGYKWYDAEHKEVLFPFGFGLSYTTFGYSEPNLAHGNGVTVKFTLTNTGKRLVGWSKAALQPSESRDISITIDPRYPSIYEEQTDAWKLLPGEYTFFAGDSSQNFPLREKI